jgi:hypothetical protein
VGHHAYGVNAAGGLVVHPGMAGEVTRDFPSVERNGGEWIEPDHDGLEQALQWARETLDRDPVVDYVMILQRVQEHDGQSWKLGRTVKRVTRDNAGAAADTGSAPARAVGQGSHGDAASAVAAVGQRGATPARRPRTRSPGTGRGPSPC